MRKNSEGKKLEAKEKLLIPVSKDTTNSLGITSFEPSGLFRFKDGSVRKVYRIIEPIKENYFPKIAKKLKSSIRLTKCFGDNKEMFLTLDANGDTLDDIRNTILEDQELISTSVTLKELDANETFNSFFKNEKPFSYVDEVRKKKDFGKSCFPGIDCDTSCFNLGNMAGESIFVMDFPNNFKKELFYEICELQSEIYVALDVAHIGRERMQDFNRNLEEKYNRIVADGRDEYFNVSMQLVIVADSVKARKILKEAIQSILSERGFVVSSAIGEQGPVAESVFRLGMSGKTNRRNVRENVVEGILGEEELWQ